MRLFQARSCALGAIIALPLLAGCSGGGSQMTTSPGAAMGSTDQVAQRGATRNDSLFSSASGLSVAAVVPSRSNTSRGFFDPSAVHQPLIFVSLPFDGNNQFVNVYLQSNHKLVGQITEGLSYPQGIDTDVRGDLYVANTYGPNVLVYAPPYRHVTETLPAEPNQEPVDVAVSRTGLVAVTSFSTNSGNGAVSFYARNTTTPCATISSPNLPRPVFAGFDAQGNLFVDGGPGFGSGTAVGEITGGCNATAFQALTTNNTITGPGDVHIDNRNRIAILQQSVSPVVIYTYDHPKNGSLGSPVSTTPLTNLAYGLGFAFLASGADLDAPASYFNESQVVNEYAYPAGGAPIETFNLGADPEDIAVTPPLQ